jgi:CheY-like chemotaxis protein
MAPRVLVVEDETPARDGLVELLRGDGFDAEGAADGAEALARLLGLPVQAVVADLTMPGMGGLELAERLRARGSMVPIVLVTARDGNGSACRDVDAVLRKPLDYGELLRRLRSIVGL